MRIQQITAFHACIALRTKVQHASHQRTENDALLVRCTLDDGTEGWGEGLPRPYVTGETIETAFEQLRATDWSTQLGAKLTDLPSAIAVCDAFRLGSGTANGRDCFGNAVRCAIELSILDAVTRAVGVPLSAVTQHVPETAAVRECNDEVRYSGALTTAGMLRQLFRAWKVRFWRFHQCKVKVGAAGVDDRVSLRRIRRMLGREVDIRVDANEAWTCENLERRLELLLGSNISAIEQPVPHGQVDGLAEIRKRISVPIMLDESLCSLSDAHRAIERGTCDVFNIRLSKCGGFVNSLRLAALAHQAGLAYQLGCQVGETGILSAAGRHFACSVGNIRYLEGSFDRYLVAESLTVEDLTFRRGGYARRLDGTGLGMTIDQDAIQRVTIATDTWTI
ncbi:MAG: dipeptide epimerase [Planctomycetota bacterium]|nr:dipeptide epimerase [Planctomycetota bacterium]